MRFRLIFWRNINLMSSVCVSPSWIPHESISKLTGKDNALLNIVLNRHFNMPDITWENSSICPNPNYSTSLNNSMVDFVNTNFLTKMTDKPTWNDNILELTLTTNLNLISDLETHPGMSDCCVVTNNVNLTVKQKKRPDRYVYQYRKGNLEGMKQDLGAIQGNSCLRNLWKDQLMTTEISSRILWSLPWKRTSHRRKLPPDGISPKKSLGHL